jgi:hypothetical protein
MIIMALRSFGEQHGKEKRTFTHMGLRFAVSNDYKDPAREPKARLAQDLSWTRW